MTESNALSRARLTELREAVETGTISWGEIAELQEAFEEIPESELPEPREHASFGDMLDELEQRLPDEDADLDEVVENVREHRGDYIADVEALVEELRTLRSHVADAFKVEHKDAGKADELVTVDHDAARVEVFWHTPTDEDEAPYLVVNVDSESDDHDMPVRIYVNDAPIFTGSTE